MYPARRELLCRTVNFIKKTERSVSLILGILGNLDHFRHLFFRYISLLFCGAEAKINMTKYS